MEDGRLLRYLPLYGTNASVRANSRIGGRGLVEEFRAFSPLAWRTAKKLLNDTEGAIELEGYYHHGRLRQSDDFREGVEASYAKRKAAFSRELTIPDCLVSRSAI